MHVIYWIYNPSHTDPFKEGYVGVTQNLTERIRGHLDALKKNMHTSIYMQHNFQNNSADMLVSILYRDEKNMCFAYEHYLRPIENIGWNISPGGYGNLALYDNSILERLSFNITETRKFLLTPKERQPRLIQKDNNPIQKLGKISNIAMRSLKR